MIVLVGINSFTHHAYFGATYIDNEKDYLVKQRINRLFQATPLCQKKIENNPKAKEDRHFFFDVVSSAECLPFTTSIS